MYPVVLSLIKLWSLHVTGINSVLELEFHIDCAAIKFTRMLTICWLYEKIEGNLFEAKTGAE